MENEKVKNVQRDYDKEPIVIIDRMPEISFWTISIYFFIAIVLVILFIPIKENLDIKYIILYSTIMYGITFLFLKSKITKIRKITCMNNKIVRQWDENILEMKFENITQIKKSFLDFYDSRQKALSVYRPIYYLLTPISLFLQHPILLVIKFIYKSLHGFFNNTIFDTIVLFDKNSEIMAIFIPTDTLKKELEEYFLVYGYDLNDLSIFYTNMYSPDEITHYFNKKEK